MTNLINLSVNNYLDISKFVTKYVSSRTQNEQTPLISTPPKKQPYIHKTTLTDWRALYKTKPTKISIHLQKNKSSSEKKLNKTERSYLKSRNSFCCTEDKKSQYKISNPYKESPIDSAIMQTYIEKELFKDQTTEALNARQQVFKSQKGRHLTSSSPNCTYEERKTTMTLHNRLKSEKISSLAKREDKRIPTSMWPEKYESIKIRRKNIRRHTDIPIEGLKELKNKLFIPGFRYI